MAEFFQSCDPPPPPSPKFSSPVKTLDESSPTAPIRALVANSLAISSPIRQIQSSPPAKSLNPGESSSPPPANLEEIEFTDSSITPPAQDSPPNNSETLQIASTSCSLDGNIDSYNRPSYIANHDSQIDHRFNFEPAKPFDFSWQSTKRELTGVGAGLYNSGNTCFIASVLQCFTHTVPLIESLRTYKYPDPCNCGNEKFCVLQALQKHVYHALKSSGFSLRIDQFRDNLNHFSPDFQINNQEDAHEFLQSLFDKLERCCLDRRSQPDSDSDSSPDVNIVDQIFGGRLLSRLHCCNCNSFSDTFEPSLGWSLEIEDVNDLYSALDSFTCIEKLEDQFTCEKCKEKVSKEKQLRFDKLPPVATFHLKRFKNDGHFMEKIFNHVKFPVELDLLPYMSDNHDPQVSTKYHLYAMVEHFGNGISFGHYTSYVRSAPETWHTFDDAKVTKVSEETVLSEYAYMLFYAREGTPLFASAFEELKTLFGPAPLNFSPKSVLESSPCREESVSDHSYENVCDSSKACNASVVGVPIPGGGNYSEFRCDEPQEEVFHSAECSSDSDSPTFDAFDYSPEAEEPEKPFAETSHQEETNVYPAENRAPVDDVSVPPERKIQNQVPSPKRKAEERDVLGNVYQPNFKLRKQDSVRRRQGTFQIQRDHLQNKKKEEEEARGTKQQPFRGVSAADPKEAEHAITYLNRMPNSARSRKLAETLGATLKKKKVSNIKRSTMGLHRNLSERPTNANLGLN